MSFQDIRDQHVPIRLLKNILRQGRVPNGLLFWGPGGVGKRLTAIEFAKALNCTERQTTPDNTDGCGECLSCRKTIHGNHPDVSILAPVKKSRIIDVESVNAMNEMASLRAFEGAWRVFIILEADRMGVSAQNHFLKTLEEPPGNSAFILVTEFPGVLLPTIRSRCQRLRFGALRPETVIELLRRHRDIPEKTAAAIAAISQGQMSRALDLVDTNKREVALALVQDLATGKDPLELAESFAKQLGARRTQIENALKAEIDGDSATRAELSKEDREDQKKQQMALAEALIRRDIMEFLYLLETWYRDAFVCGTVEGDVPVLNRDQLDRLRQTPQGNFDKKLAAIEKARVYLERFLNEERVFRDLFLALADSGLQGAV